MGLGGWPAEEGHEGGWSSKEELFDRDVHQSSSQSTSNHMAGRTLLLGAKSSFLNSKAHPHRSSCHEWLLVAPVWDGASMARGSSRPCARSLGQVGRRVGSRGHAAAIGDFSWPQAGHPVLNWTALLPGPGGRGSWQPRRRERCSAASWNWTAGKQKPHRHRGLPAGTAEPEWGAASALSSSLRLFGKPPGEFHTAAMPHPQRLHSAEGAAQPPGVSSTLDRELDETSVFPIRVDGVAREEDRIPPVSWLQLERRRRRLRSSHDPAGWASKLFKNQGIKRSPLLFPMPGHLPPVVGVLSPPRGLRSSSCVHTRPREQQWRRGTPSPHLTLRVETTSSPLSLVAMEYRMLRSGSITVSPFSQRMMMGRSPRAVQFSSLACPLMAMVVLGWEVTMAGTVEGGAVEERPVGKEGPARAAAAAAAEKSPWTPPPPLPWRKQRIPTFCSPQGPSSLLLVGADGPRTSGRQGAPGWARRAWSGQESPCLEPHGASFVWHAGKQAISLWVKPGPREARQKAGGLALDKWSTCPVLSACGQGLKLAVRFAV